jgi:hypothetical protein
MGKAGKLSRTDKLGRMAEGWAISPLSGCCLHRREERRSRRQWDAAMMSTWLVRRGTCERVVRANREREQSRLWHAPVCFFVWCAKRDTYCVVIRPDVSDVRCVWSWYIWCYVRLELIHLMLRAFGADTSDVTCVWSWYICCYVRLELMYVGCYRHALRTGSASSLLMADAICVWEW